MYSASHLRRAVATVVAANILTWYEFSLYLLFSPILAAQFFPHQSPGTGLIHILLIFAVGFIARPFGTLFFSHIGDKLGRRTSLICSILLMTIPSFGIGLTPSYASIGIGAPLLLTFFRLIQEFATGGEFAGSMTYLYEITPIRYRRLTGGLTFSSSQLGNVLATLELLLIENFFPTDSSSWKWRIPFLCGGGLGLIAWYLRSRLHETPLFETSQTEGKVAKKPILESLSLHKKGILTALGITTLTAAGWSIIFIFSPLYLSDILGLTRHQKLFMNSFLLCGSALLIPFFGYLADQHHRKRLFTTSAIGIFLLALPLYFSAQHFSLAAFLSLEVALVLLLTIQFALLPSILCELFPLRVRYTCVGISYNFAIVLFGGWTPFVILLLSDKAKHFLTPAFALMVTALLSLYAYFSIKKTLSD